jgi:hypothetical protein
MQQCLAFTTKVKAGNKIVHEYPSAASKYYYS